MDSKNKKIAHLFHWPSFPEYQENLLQTIALPTGARGKLKYNEKWVNNSFIDEVENINRSDGYEAIFWVLSCKETKNDNDNVIAKFDFACPVRLVKILTVKKEDDYHYINFIAQDFISKFSIIDNRDALKEFTEIGFDDAKTPYPGVEKGFAYIGPEIEEVKTTPKASLEALYKVLENIPCSLNCKEGIKIKEYPLVKIETIENSKIDKSGLYNLSINREYKIAFSYYQEESYRNRNVYINKNRFIGKSVTDKISIEEIRKSKDKINIKVKCDNLSFIIPLNVAVKIPWYKQKFTPIIVLTIISALVVFIFIKLFPKSDIEITTALIFAIIVMLVDKFWEVLTKKD